MAGFAEAAFASKQRDATEPEPNQAGEARGTKREKKAPSSNNVEREE
eukprot:gene21479-28455_t